MRVLPHDRADYQYTIPQFTAGVGGTLRLKLADGQLASLTVRAGETVALPVRRVYRTGTTAARLQTSPLDARDTPDYHLAVPFAAVADGDAEVVTALWPDEDPLLWPDLEPVKWPW